MEDYRAQIYPVDRFLALERTKVARRKSAIELVFLKQSDRFRQDHFLCSL